MNMNRKFFRLSLTIAVLITILVPNVPGQSAGVLRYLYGFPMNWITVFQLGESSPWLLTNLLAGNAGVNINPAVFLMNVVILYLMIRLVMKLHHRLVYSGKATHSENIG